MASRSYTICGFLSRQPSSTSSLTPHPSLCFALATVTFLMFLEHIRHHVPQGLSFAGPSVCTTLPSFIHMGDMSSNVSKDFPDALNLTSLPQHPILWTTDFSPPPNRCFLASPTCIIFLCSTYCPLIFFFFCLSHGFWLPL